MNTVKITAGIVLIVVTLWLCVRYRRLFLPDGGVVGWLRLIAALVCLTLLTAACWAGFYAVTLTSGWVRNALYSILPLAVMASYFYEIFTFKHLPREWKRSPLFILAIPPPVLGCIFMILVWWQHRGRLQYAAQLEQMKGAE